MYMRRFFPLLLCTAILAPQVVSAAATTLTSQADFESAVVRTGLDTSTTPNALQLPSLSIAASPAAEARTVALLVSDDASVDADVTFYLDSYFASEFTYGGDEAADDVLEFADVNEVADITSYDVVVVDATTTSEGELVPQDVIDAFANAGGTVVESLIGYSRQRQRDTYAIEQNFTYTAAAVRDMAYDGTYIWMLDDTSPDRVEKIDPATGTTVSTYCTPNTGPRGIEYVGGTLYITDTTADKLHAITPAALTPYDGVCGARAQGTVYNLSDLTPDPTSPWGLTHDGTYFYLVDSVSDKLYKFTISGANLVQSTAWDLTLTPRAVDLPRGLAFDGTSVYLADAGTNLIYQLSTVDASVVNAFDTHDGFGAADMDPTGITFIDGDLWVTDDEPGIKKLFNNTSYYRDTDAFEYFSRGNTSLETPSFDPKGLVYDGTYFWSVDDYANRLYKLNATTGAVVSSCQTPWSRPAGLAYNAGVLYLSDHSSDLIYLINPDTCAVSSSYATPGTNGRGLAHDGTNLWAADTSSDLVYKMNPSTGVVASSFAAPADNSRGLAWDGTYLWLADEGTDLYYQINTADGSVARTRSVVELTADGITFKDGMLWSSDDVQDRLYNVDSALIAQGQMAVPSGSPQGFTYDGTNLWLVDSGTDTVYKLNASTGAVVTSFAAPALDPRDITWDGSSLWITTDADNKIYKVNPATGATITSFAAPASDPTGIVYADALLYVSDPVSNKVYEIDPADGSVDANYAAPGSASGSMAYDGTHVWLHDTDERIFYKLVFDDDADEGIVETTQDVYSTAIQGIEFIGGTLWTVDSYFDMFFDADVISTEPTAVVEVDSAATSPYEVDDAFYFTTRNTTEGFYIHRRLTSVPETADREILASSNRGGAVFIHEDRTSGDIYAMDFVLLGDNFEVSRQTVPAVTFFLNAMGILIHDNGNFEASRPTYDSLVSDLDGIMSSCGEAFTRTQIGTASNSEPIYAYSYGTDGKPIALYLSGTHGNEEHGYVPEIRWMQDLCSAYLASSDRARNVYSNYEVIFVPLLNPFGIESLSRYNANGVDLNRNYDYNWATWGSRTKGSAAFSEPETQALRDLVLANENDIVFVNDAHSGMAISPGMTWGCDFGGTAPPLITDIYNIFRGQNAYRWYETNVSVTRWMTYDRHAIQDCEIPYFGNWVSSLGIPSSTNEVFGKKDVGTQRMIHTNAWYKSHFDASFDALSSRYGRSVFRIDGGGSTAKFLAAATTTATTPEGTSVALRYGSSATTTPPTTWYTTYASAPANRYGFVEVTLARDSYAVSSPTVQDISANFAVQATGSSLQSIFSVTRNIYDFAITQESSTTTALQAGKEAQLSWRTTGIAPLVSLYYTTSAGRQVIARNTVNRDSYQWKVPENLSGPVTLTVETTDLLTTTATATLEIAVTGAGGETASVEDEQPVSGPALPVDIVSPGDYIRSRTIPTVYYIDEQYQRHPFIDAQTFFTWQYGFENVRVVDDALLPQLVLGRPMPPKPRTVLVKIQSIPRVYLVEENAQDSSRPLLRWIPSEDMAVTLFGLDWAEYVIDIPVTSFSHFAAGKEIESADEVALSETPMRRRDELYGH